MGGNKAGNLVALLEKTAVKFPDSEAVVSEQTRVSYRKLNEEANRLANALIKCGIKKGDRVLLMAPNIPQFIMAYFGILKAAGTVVPVNIFFKGEELKFILNHCASAFAIVFSPFAERFKEIKQDLPHLKNIISFGGPASEDSLVWENLTAKESSENIGLEIAPQDTAAIIYTSGTTGRPKGAMLTHFNLTSNISSITMAFGSTDPEVMLCVLPLFHAFAATVCMLFSVSIGSKIVVMNHFKPHEVLQSISKEKVTIFAAVPTMYGMLSQVEDISGLDFSSWRLAISGGAALPLEIMKSFEKRFPVLIYEGDGPTECSPVTSTNPIGGRRKLGSIGLPIPGVRMKIVDDKGAALPPEQIGEIAVKGPNVMKGYLNDPQATRESIKDGWFHTGDMGKVDEEGYFYILDRKKDMVNVGGFNVYPREVEEVIYANPKVKDAAVVASPDRKGLRGEIPKAFIVLKQGMEMTDKEFIQYCHKHLAGYKVPREVEFCESLPMTATGKIQKKILKEKEWSESNSAPNAV
jgi:long-chain acyl-CoA synthetase